MNHAIRVVSLGLETSSHWDLSSLNVTICRFCSCTASHRTLGSLPCTSNPQILQYDSEAVINFELTNSVNFIHAFCQILILSPASLFQLQLMPYLDPCRHTKYKYLQDFILLYISTLICALYFLLRYGLYRTTYLLCNWMPFFIHKLYHHSFFCNVDIHQQHQKFFLQSPLETPCYTCHQPCKVIWGYSNHMDHASLMWLQFCTIQEIVLVWNFSTNNVIIVFWIPQFAFIIIYGQNMCMRWTSLLSFNNVYEGYHLTKDICWSIVYIMQ